MKRCEIDTAVGAIKWRCNAVNRMVCPKEECHQTETKSTRTCTHPMTYCGYMPLIKNHNILSESCQTVCPSILYKLYILHNYKNDNDGYQFCHCIEYTCRCYLNNVFIEY